MILACCDTDSLAQLRHQSQSQSQGRIVNSFSEKLKANIHDFHFLLNPPSEGRRGYTKS